MGETRCRGGDVRSTIPACSAPAAPDPAPTPPPAPRPPAAFAARRVGDYELLDAIAHGGMGAVYRARQVGVNRAVALKMILAGRFASAAEVQRFRAEAAAAGALDHPNIVPVYEVGEHEGRHFFSMKLVTGGSLASRVADYQRDPRAAAALIAAVARAVHHAHQHGVLHRDLKPSNILLDGDGRPYVSDFGLAKRFDADGGLTQSEAVVGTPSYMAPEQASGGSKRATIAADVYGLGAILYELLSGRPPFQADTRLETLRRVQEQEPSSIRPANRKVGRDLETVCLKCLSKDPRRRYASAEALADDLERWLAGRPVRARRTSAAERAWRWSRRHPASAALVAVVFLSTLSLAVGATWHARRLSGALAVARQEGERARSVTGFLKNVLELASPERAGGRKLSVEEALGEASRLAGRQFAGQPLVEAEVRTIIGAVYRELGVPALSAADHEKALDIRAARLGPEHPDTIASEHLLAEAQVSQGFPMVARRHAQKAYDMRLRDLGADHVDTFRSLAVLADTYRGRSVYDRAAWMHRQALGGLQRKLGPAHPESLRVKADWARDLAGLGEFATAERLYGEAIEGLLSAPDVRRDALVAMMDLARALEAMGRFDEAEQKIRDAIDIRSRLLTPDHVITVRSRFGLGKFLLRRGPDRLEEAQRVLGEVLETQRRTPGTPPGHTVDTMSYLADVLERRGQHGAALALRLEMMADYRRHLHVDAPPPTPGRVLDHGWADVLDKLDPARHAVAGEWGAAGGGVAVKPSLFARAAIPVDVRGSYELEVTFTRTAGDGSVDVTIPVGRGGARLLLSALHGRRHLLREVWGKGLSDNPTAVHPGLIENNRRYVLLVRVDLCGDDARVEAFLAGKPCLVPYDGPQEGLLAPGSSSLPAHATLAVGAHDGDVTFHRVRVRTERGRGEARLVTFDPAHWKAAAPSPGEP